MATNILPSQIQSAGLDQNQVLAWNGSAFAAAITIAVGNSTVNTSINATSFSGTANNANNLGGTSLATLQGQITGNAATAYTNATSYADNKAANAYSNAISYANTAAANAYSNAITYSANASNLGNGTVAPARLGSGTANSTTILYGNGVFAPAPDSTNASSLTTGTINVSLLASYGTANSTTVLYGNSVWGPAPSSTNASALISGTVNTSLLGSGTANSTTILYGNGVFAAAPDGVNTAFQYTFTNTISFSSNVSLVSGNGTNQLLIGTINATSIGLLANSTTLTVGNSSVNTVVNATSFSGTANNANNLGGTSLATLQNQITGNTATAYSNGTSYTDIKAGNAYSNAASYADTVAANAYTNAISYANTAAGTAYTNATSYTDIKAGNAYTNATSYADTKAGNAYTNATTYVTTGGYTITGAVTHSGNVNITGNTTSILNIGTINATSIGLSANSTLLTIGNSSVNTTVNATAFSGTANNADNLGGLSLGQVQGNAASNAATAYTNATSYADTKAANAYSNATSYADIKAGNAYSNATSYVTAGGYTVVGDVTFSGNVFVNGTTFNANVTNLNVKDLNILVGDGAASNASSDGAGLIVSTPNAQLFYSGGSNTWNTNRTFTPSSNVTFDLGSTTLTWSNVFANQVYGTLMTSLQPNITANNANNLGGTSLATLQTEITGNAATAYTNATSYADTKAGTAYSNGTSYTDIKAGNAYTNATSYVTTGGYTISGVVNYSGNVILTSGNGTNQLLIGTINATSIGLRANSTILTIGNSSVNTTVNATSFSGIANNANNLGGTSLATLQGQITGNAATAYTNATTYSANASNLGNGTVAPARLGSGTANSTTILYGNGVFAPAADGVNTAFQYTFTNAISFSSNVSITLGLLNGTVGATAPNTGAFTTLSTSGIITASTVGNIIPFYYANQAGFPSAATYHGALAHSHSDGAMYFAHASVWTRLLDTGGGYTVSGTATYSGNVILTSGNSTNQLLLGTINATSIGLLANSTTLTTGNSTVNTTISATNTTLYTPTMRGSRETVLANTNAAGAMTLDLSYGIHRWTVTGNVTSLNFTNVPANNTVFNGMLYVTANATGTNSTNRAITFPSTANATTGKTLFSGGVAPPATSSNSSLDIYSFTTIDGGNNYIWSLSVKDAR